MVEALGRRLTEVAQRAVPDPFVLALALTVAVGLAGVGLTDHGPWALVGFWRAGFFDLLRFGMQMALILVAGHALAVSPPVRAVARGLARVPRSGPEAAALVCAATVLAALVNWGLGLVVGALLARDTAIELEGRGIPAHYPLLGAAGYAGLAVWHGGLSGSAPLAVAQAEHDLVALAGVIPITETLGSSSNLAVNAVLLLLLPATFWVLHPRDAAQVQTVRGWSPARESAGAEPARGGWGGALEGHWAPAWGFGLLGLAQLAVHLGSTGLAGLDLDAVIWGSLFAGLCAQGSLRGYLDAFADGTRATAGVLLQFPFYAGIMGMMKHSGLVAVLSGWVIAVSDAGTFPAVALLSAGLVNLFVPSGGGQWAIQGPILLEAGNALGVPPATTVMALAYGDQWTNLVQPFWALPLLGVTGLKAGDLMGYGLVALGVTGLVFAVGLSWA